MKQIRLSLILFTNCMVIASCTKAANQERAKEAVQEMEEVGREIVREICACGPSCGCHDSSSPHAGCGKDDSCGCHEHCSCMD